MSNDKNIGEQKHRKRIRQVYIISGLSALVGLPFGFMFGRLSKGTLTIDSGTLIFFLIVLTVAFFYLTWAWYKTMDEFERSVFHESGNIAFHFGFIALPWFVLSEQGVVPPLDAAYLMCGMAVIFCILLIVRKGISYT